VCVPDRAPPKHCHVHLRVVRREVEVGGCRNVSFTPSTIVDQNVGQWGRTSGNGVERRAMGSNVGQWGRVFTFAVLIEGLV
jgi:hypothetical protein